MKVKNLPKLEYANYHILNKYFMNDIQLAMLHTFTNSLLPTKKLTLYPEDFEKTHIWKDVCDCLGVSYNSQEIHIECINVKTYEDD